MPHCRPSEWHQEACTKAINDFLSCYYKLQPQCQLSSSTAICQGVPEKEQKQTKMSGHFPHLKIFNGTNVLMIRDSDFSFGGNYFCGN
jgi:hypothetical protein